jgi:hypothetical protein
VWETSQTGTREIEASREELRYWKGQELTAVIPAILVIETAIHKLDREVCAHCLGHKALLENVQVVVPGILFKERSKRHLVVGGSSRLVADVVQRPEALRVDVRLARVR